MGIFIIGVPDEKEKEKEPIEYDHCWKYSKSWKTYTHSWNTKDPNWTQSKKDLLQGILSKIKDKERKNKLYIKKSVWLHSNFSTRVPKARKEWHEVFKVWKENISNQEYYIQWCNPWEMKEINKVLDKQTLDSSVSDQPYKKPGKEYYVNSSHDNTKSTNERGHKRKENPNSPWQEAPQTQIEIIGKEKRRIYKPINKQPMKWQLFLSISVMNLDCK